MLVIRLRRTGRKKAPKFRVVVAEKTMPIYGRFVDIIGHVDMQADPKVIEIDKERAEDWIKKGAQPTETVARLMVKVNILKKDDLNWKPDKKRKKKAEAKKEAKEGGQSVPEAPKSEDKPKEDKEEAPKEESKPEEKVAEKPQEKKEEKTEKSTETKTEEVKIEEPVKEEPKVAEKPQVKAEEATKDKAEPSQNNSKTK